MIFLQVSLSEKRFKSESCFLLTNGFLREEKQRKRTVSDSHVMIGFSANQKVLPALFPTLWIFHG